MDIMLQLGEVQFSINSLAYQKFSRVTKYNWQSNQRLGNHPSSEFIGDGEDTITLDGVIFPDFRGGFDQIEIMRKEAQKAKAMPLVSGAGDILGNWIILEIKENISNFSKGGKPIKQEFTISLKYHG